MKFSSSLDTALRMLIMLGNSTGLARLNTITNELHSSYHNVVRIVGLLSNAGIIITKRGKSGGILLALPVEEISIRLVMDVIDGPVSLALCSFRKENCELSSDCTLRDNLWILQEQINELIGNISIKDIMEGNLIEEAINV